MIKKQIYIPHIKYLNKLKYRHGGCGICGGLCGRDLRQWEEREGGGNFVQLLGFKV